MGKRELLLIVGFLIVGAVVYQATAPAPDPNAKGFSFSRFVEAARREIRGNRATSEVTRTQSIALDAETSEIRVIGYVTHVEIAGEARADVEATLRVHSRAYDDAEAKKYAEETVLKPDLASTRLTLEVDYVEGRHTGRQAATLILKVPSRMRARVESRPGKLLVSNIAGLEASNSGGDTTITKIDGRVEIVHRGGKLTITDVARLKLTGRSAEVRVTGVASDAAITIEQGGELSAGRIGGPLEVESRNAELTFEALENTRGPIRINSTNGSLTLKGLKSETRIDARNVDVSVAMAGAAPVAIYSDGEDVGLVPPPDGFRLDAVITNGRIAPDTMIKELGIETTTPPDSQETRATATVRGGGPTITIRATRADLTFREREAAAK